MTPGTEKLSTGFDRVIMLNMIDALM